MHQGNPTKIQYTSNFTDTGYTFLFENKEPQDGHTYNTFIEWTKLNNLRLTKTDKSKSDHFNSIARVDVPRWKIVL